MHDGYLSRNIPVFVMYCVYGESGSSILTESTESVIFQPNCAEGLHFSAYYIIIIIIIIIILLLLFNIYIYKYIILYNYICIFIAVNFV